MFAETTANPELSLGLIVYSIMITDIFRVTNAFFITAVIEVNAIMVRCSLCVLNS
jgi:hypothetical protein